MIALLLATVPFVDAFWAKDLGALARELVEDPAGGEEHLLFADLLKLATCAPLDKIDQPSPLRELVRAEEARRGTRGTIWDDLLRKEFFARKPWNPSERGLLRWPDETERWSNETLLVAEPPWRCANAKPGKGALPLLNPLMIRSLPPDAAARSAYERAVLRYRQGALEGIAEVDPALLPAELRPATSFLRLEAGVDAADGWIALARTWPHPGLVLRAAQRLYETGRHAELVELSALDEKPSLWQRHVLILKALSLHALGRDPEMLDAIFAALAQPGPTQGFEPLRALAIQALAKMPFDAQKLGRVASPVNPAIEELARQAMAQGNFTTASDAARALASDSDPRWRGQGLALAGEAAFRAGDVAQTSDAFMQIFAPREKLATYRDPAALQLAQALVVTHAQHRDAAAGRLLIAQLDKLQAQVHLKALPQVQGLLTAAREEAVERGEQPVALGEVNIGLQPLPPPAPKIEIDLPEPRSLLAIPAQDGSLRAWFEGGGAP